MAVLAPVRLADEPDNETAVDRPSAFLPLAGLTLAFGLSRLGFYLAGIRFDGSVLSGTSNTDMYQLVDVHLLHDQLITSVWHLQSQPPLFNLYGGLVLQLPHGLQGPAEVITFLALGLVMVLATYLLLSELGVPRWLAVAATLVLVVVAPAFVLYENWLNYAYPTAALLTLSGWLLLRYLRRKQWGYGLGFFASLSAVVLLNSTYQVEWMVVAVALAVIAARHRWRQVLMVAAIPVLVVGGWYIKDAVLFGTSSTSSWLGMNLARDTLYGAPRPEVAAMVRDGRLTPLAAIPAFQGPNTYIPRFVVPTRTGTEVLDQLTKADGAPNFNNLLYVSVSSQYLRDDLAFIAAHPGEYAGDVNISVRNWFTATDQNFTTASNWPRIEGYTRAYDHAVEWQPQIDPDVAIVAFFNHSPPGLNTLSYQAIVMFALTLLGLPVLAWRRRKDDPAMAGTLAFLWLTVGYALVLTSLVETGENERFRFELGTLPAVGGIVVLVAIGRTLGSRARTRAEARTQTPTAMSGHPDPVPPATR
ncbi:MAG TPA: hypothetical protein VHT49_12535 [Acidimicrobiales bacterium]|nr:hypothetical protein [Acidimicrobiales bacterium]